VQISEELLEALRRAEPGAFDEFVRSTHAMVYSLAYRMTGNSEDAKDVTQEVYVRAWRGLKQFRGDANLGTWLHRITVNCAITATKRRSRNPVPVPDDAFPEEAIHDPDQADRALLEAALATLPDDDRVAVVLKDVEGWTCEEIAKLLKTTEGAIKVRVFRARQRLADRLRSDGVVVPMKRKAPGEGR
jgi:RNA polymerase sigma-70 factor, ECF subfamily